jgi:ABC-type transport system involved in cytochrome bd biosynthesis fused ATPase/permease subunit
VSEAITPLVDAMRALARANGSERRIDALLDLSPAVSDLPRKPVEWSRPHDPNRAETTTRPHDPVEWSRPPDPNRAETTTRPGASDGVDLATRRLTASWTGTRTDLRPTDLDLPAGTRLVVTGPNGSGKSTLLAVLARHLDPSFGEYLLDGSDVRDQPLEHTRSRVAVVDAETHVFATTLRNNLTLACPDASDDAVVAALTAAGLGDLLGELAEGLDTRLGAGGRGLSGGERARLGIARAHLSGRPVILLDEPVAHLDPPTARAVVADLTSHTNPSRELDAGPRTLVMVTHRDEGTDLFERVLEMHQPASVTMPSTTVVTGDRAHEADPPRR